MISSVFIDRPRLAFVISIVITLAGLLALQAIPQAQFPDIKIIHDPVANWLREEAMTQMEAALSAHAKIDLVYAHNDPMAMGAYLAAKAKGRDTQMKFVGIDGLPGLDGGRQAVQDGKLAATFVYPTGVREAIDVAAKHNRKP